MHILIEKRYKGQRGRRICVGWCFLHHRRVGSGICTLQLPTFSTSSKRKLSGLLATTLGKHAEPLGLSPQAFGAYLTKTFEFSPLRRQPEAARAAGTGRNSRVWAQRRCPIKWTVLDSFSMVASWRETRQKDRVRKVGVGGGGRAGQGAMYASFEIFERKLYTIAVL